MYAIVGASGRTGSVVAERLLARKEQVRVVLRDPAKAPFWTARGAEVALADLLDGPALVAALRGVRAAYLMVPPPGFDATGILDWHRRIVDTLAQAAADAALPYGVVLSSAGAQHAKGTGTIQSLHYAEQRLGASPTPMTFLRAGYFMENWSTSLGSVLEQGTLPTYLTPEHKIPMIAARDIGEFAAAQLLHGPPPHRVLNLAGPEDYSPLDAAAAFSRASERVVRVHAEPPHAMVAALTGFGASAELAALYEEMTEAVNSGLVSWEPGAPVARGSVSFDTFAAALVSSAV